MENNSESQYTSIVFDQENNDVYVNLSQIMKEMETDSESHYAPIDFDQKNNDEYVNLSQILKEMETGPGHIYGTSENVQATSLHEVRNSRQVQQGMETDPGHSYGTSEHDVDNNNVYGNPQQVQQGMETDPGHSYGTSENVQATSLHEVGNSREDQQGMEDKHAQVNRPQQAAAIVKYNRQEMERKRANEPKEVREFVLDFCGNQIMEFKVECLKDLFKHEPILQCAEKFAIETLATYLDVGTLIHLGSLARQSSREIVLRHMAERKLQLDVVISREELIVNGKPTRYHVAKTYHTPMNVHVSCRREKWSELITALSHSRYPISTITLRNGGIEIDRPRIFSSYRTVEALVFDKITKLTLINTMLEGKKVKNLMKLAKSLTELSIHQGGRVDLTSIPAHVKSRLERVSLRMCILPQAGILALAECRNLRVLNLDRILYVEHVKDFKAQFGHYADHWNLMFYLPSEFAQLRNLEKLDIIGGLIAGDSHVLAKLPSLKHLTLILHSGVVKIPFMLKALGPSVCALTLKGDLELTQLDKCPLIAMLNVDMRCIFKVKDKLNLLFGTRTKICFDNTYSTVGEWPGIFGIYEPNFYCIGKSELEDLLNLPCKWERVILYNPIDLSLATKFIVCKNGSVWKLNVIKAGRTHVREAVLTIIQQAPARANNRAE